MLFKKRYTEVYNSLKGHKYAFCLKADDIPVGYVHVSGDGSYDLGYGLRTNFWHKGIVTEACMAVLQQVKEDASPISPLRMM
ncbi:MAG: GNAT family N-acetyltransferase [Christensenellales bacterium]|jgi:ribosomal-protein-alanine N-acetyltransferase